MKHYFPTKLLLNHISTINIKSIDKKKDVPLSKNIHNAYSNFLSSNVRLRQEKTSKNKGFSFRRFFYWIRSKVAFNGAFGKSQYSED